MSRLYRARRDRRARLCASMRARSPSPSPQPPRLGGSYSAG